MRFSKLSSLYAVGSFALLTGSVFAADGLLDSTSNASSEITITVNDAVKISSLSPIQFSNYGGSNTGGTSAYDSFCVYVNGAGTYNLTASTSTNAYKLVGDGTVDEIGYTLAFNGASSTSTTGVNIDAASAEFTGSQSLNCGGSNNASVNIMISDAELLTALTDTYRQTVTVTVNPQ